MVDFLIAQGTSCRSTDRGTPLHGICWQGEYTDPEPNIACERIIRSLIVAGVPIDAQDAEGNTPLHEAVDGDWSNQTAVRVLLELGAEPDLTNKNGRTPLHLAAARGALDCAKLLLAAGANSRRRDSQGKTPVDLAHQNHRSWKRIVAEDKALPRSQELAAPENMAGSPAERHAHYQEVLQQAADCLAAIKAAT